MAHEAAMPNARFSGREMAGDEGQLDGLPRRRLADAAHIGPDTIAERLREDDRQRQHQKQTHKPAGDGDQDYPEPQRIVRTAGTRGPTLWDRTGHAQTPL
jgi:hypothetical protein